MLSSLSKGCGLWNGDLNLATDQQSLPALDNSNSCTHRHGVTVSPRAKTAPAPVYMGRDGHLHMPKTFTTRKGALMLFSGPDTPVKAPVKTSFARRKRRAQKELLDLSLKLRTVERLSMSVLQYGDEAYNKEASSITDKENTLFFNFMHDINPEADDSDVHSQPGGDLKFYLRDLRRRARSRRHGYAESGPYRAKSAELQELLDELEEAWPRPTSGYTAESFVSLHSARDEGFVWPPRSGSPTPSAGSLSQSGVLSSQRLIASLRSLSHMGRPGSTDLDEYAPLSSSLPLRSSSTLSLSRSQSAKSVWNAEASSPSVSRPRTSQSGSRLPQDLESVRLVTSPEHTDVHEDEDKGKDESSTVWVDVDQAAADTSFEDFQSGVSLTESDQMALDRQTQTPVSIRSRTPHRYTDADSQIANEELASLPEEGGEEELMETMNNEGDWPTQEEQPGRTSSLSSRAKTPLPTVSEGSPEEDEEENLATHPLEPPYTGLLMGEDTEREDSFVEQGERSVSRTSTLTAKTLSRGPTPAGMLGQPDDATEQASVPEPAVRAPSAQGSMTPDLRTQDPDTLVSLHTDSNMKSSDIAPPPQTDVTPPSQTDIAPPPQSEIAPPPEVDTAPSPQDKAALALAAVAKMDSKLGVTPRKESLIPGQPALAEEPVAVETEETPEETPRSLGPKRREKAENQKLSLLQEMEMEDQKKQDGQESGELSDRVKAEKEEKEKKKAALREEKEQQEKLEREKAQAKEDKRKAAEERLKQRAEELAKKKEEEKLQQQQEVKLAPPEEAATKSPKASPVGGGKKGKGGKSDKAGAGTEKQAVKSPDITAAQSDAANKEPVKDSYKTEGGIPGVLMKKPVVQEKEAEIPEHLKEMMTRKTDSQAQEDLDNQIGKVHSAIDEALEGSVLSTSGTEGLSEGLTEEDFEAAQEALKEKIRKAEEKIEEAVEGKKPAPQPEPKTPEASPKLARKGGKQAAEKPGKKKTDKNGKKSPAIKKKGEENDKKKEAQLAREAAREQQRQEKQRRLEEFKQLQEKIKEKEDDRKLKENEAKRKQEELEERMESIRQEEEEIERAEQDAREQLAAVRKAQREERETRRKADLEKKKQDAINRREKEKMMMEEARKKEREMLEKITDAEMARRLREEEEAKREEEEMLAQERFEAELKEAQRAAEEEEEKLRELERQAEEEAFQRILEEKEAAEEKRWELEEQARVMREEEEKARREMLEEQKRLEEDKKKVEAEEEARREQERERLKELQRLEEEARERMRNELEKRRQWAMRRREHNLDSRAHLDAMRQSQGITDPWTFSYFVRWPKESYMRPMGQDPKKQKGAPRAKPQKAAPQADSANPPPAPAAVDVSLLPS